MVTAIVLINARRDAVNETAQALVELDGVAEVYSVAGPWDEEHSTGHRLRDCFPHDGPQAGRPHKAPTAVP